MDWRNGVMWENETIQNIIMFKCHTISKYLIDAVLGYFTHTQNMSNI